MVKAVGLFSGGLDSILSSKLLKNQGIDVRLVNFTTPFFPSRKAEVMATKMGMKLKVIDVTKDYLKVLRNPKHGYGAHLNPCIDCKIFMLRQAKKYAKKIGAQFVFTGEVLGQRPMSQHKQALKLIEKESGLKGRLLRPLSAKLLPPTRAEKWVDRQELLDIQGRGRERQIKLANKFKIRSYPSPAGGCLLTNNEYAAKAKDLFDYKKSITLNEIKLLKVGRHFRMGKSKIIVGRNENDNKEISRLRKATDFLFEVPKVGSPLTLLSGPKTKEALELSARLTAGYSDSKERFALVKYGKKLEKQVKALRMPKEEADKFRIISFS